MQPGWILTFRFAPQYDRFMVRRLRKRHVVATAAIAVSIALLAGCSGLLGFSDYSVAENTGDSGAEASLETSTADAGDGGNEASCNVDLTLQCYPCAPTTTDQFLNGCTDGTCIQFDKTRLTGLLGPDGGLPRLDGG
jgi:hypothetical protein